MTGGVRGILLCGGRSTRFGSDKLLSRHSREGGRPVPLAVRSASHLIAGAGNALAVIPPGAVELRSLLEEAGCEVLESPRTERGLGASLAAAVAHSPRAAGWIVALGDMPFIEPATIAAVRAALESGAAIAAPVHGAEKARGHPVGFSRRFAAELAALDGDEGARSLIAMHRGEVTIVPVDDAGILADVDRPADLDRHS
ncbi:MAG: nucleotidyltransferase family protein [Usitatibacter sp.]